MKTVSLSEDMYERLVEVAKQESNRTGWTISVEDVIRRAVKIMLMEVSK